MATNDQAVLQVDGLRMRYGSNDVLHDVSFRVDEGEVVAMLGPNGAGKTTTIEILEGFRMRSAGRVTVLGADPAHGDEHWRARVGVVLQSWRDHGKWRVRELLSHLGSYYTGHSTDLIRRPWDVDDLIAAVGLTEHADKKVRMLSGGQRRRLDVAIGLVGRPELLFLDEPTVGFDPEARREFHDLIQELASSGGTAILLTTHDLVEAEKLADRIVILNGGRIVADGTAAELAHQIAGADEVRWALDGRHFTRSTPDSTRFAFDLFRQHGEAVTELEIHRSSLEDTYLSLVRRAESGPRAESAHQLGKVA
ncbi:ABC transporter ATP-binding protein [Nocardia mexicana]|uniref:ABC-2 type transport system ATP-binding protein n=1 Tax=Nocardia mexicana TaxID=279262 RepID=A0A370HCF9_9NOCA|nr:ABC transporter ATP-binding protein [Nocardia mexicana]RDI54387.1 ABC-2 type transport system ATP-binding protein [Nocardia mexicana]